jgi:Protein of unknown function (DUF938)
MRRTSDGPATLRNREAILVVLRAELPPAGTILEVASGSGEHVVWFAGQMDDLVWQPSDPEPAALASIADWSRDAPSGTVLPPVMLDSAAPEWPVTHADALLCCNMVHIAPWQAAVGLFAGAGRILPSGAPLILYGPFIEADVETAPGNVAFDASLKDRDARWGLRRFDALDTLAVANGLVFARRYAMPANNLALVWRKV